MSSATIHIVDDDQALRTALTRLLSAHGYTVAPYESGTAFLERVPDDAAGCILLDVDMPGLTGLQLQEHLGRIGSILPIVFLTGNGNIAMSVKAIKAGAEDFLAKPVASEDLLAAIERALARYREAAQANQGLRDLQARYASLSGREREVFELVIQGLLNKQIAYELGNTERTVKAQRQAVMEKLGARSVAELVQMGVQLGLLKPGAGQ